MKLNRRILFTSVVLLLGVTGFFAFQYLRSESNDIKPSADVGAPTTSPYVSDPAEVQTVDSPFFKKTSITLKQFAVDTTCAKLLETIDALKAKDTFVDDTFWQDEKHPADRFIFFDVTDRTLTVCDHGKMVRANFADGKKYVDDASGYAISVERGLGDMNRNGFADFLMFDGMCAEGPCIGFRYLLEVENDRIVQRYEILADDVTPFIENKDSALLLERYCYDYNFDAAFAYFSIVRFSGNGILETVPIRRLKKSYPNIYRGYIGEIREKTDLILGTTESTMQSLAFAKIQNLILDAYDGQKVPALEENFQAIVTSLKHGRPSYDLNLHCDPVKIIQFIAEAK